MTNYLDYFYYIILGDNMRKVIIIIFLFLLICFGIFNNKDNGTRKISSNNEKKGVFISYIDLRNYVKNSDVFGFKENICKMLDNISSLKFNMIILQVVSFSDAIYESSIYPWSSVISVTEGVSPGFSVLDYFIEEAHKRNIGVYAWINPYRVRSSNDISSITDDSPAFKYIDTDTLYVNEGIYYNPAKKEVTDLIVSGVREIVTKYDVDGILFDDYFYPDLEVSRTQYEEYLKNNKKITFNDYRLMIINEMVEKVHKVCKDNKVLFGISPDGNIENNYNKVFADVRTWLDSDKYVDFIMPQVYYGFHNETRPFLKTIHEWNDLIKNKDIDLYIALAFYKVGSIDNYAKTGKLEWQSNSDIIMKEILLSRNLKQYKGFCLFRYGNLFDKALYTMTTLKEIENMQKIVK